MITRLHHVSHRLWLWHVPLIPWLIKVFNRLVFGVVLSPSSKIGQNVLFSYQGLGTVIHKEAEIHDDAIIATGVTIGGRSGRQGAPVLEEGGLVGSGAKIPGPIRVGKFASIGANAVVLNDVPPYAVAVGVPARVVRINRPEDIPKYDHFL